MIKVSDCRHCGIIVGDSVELNFPNTPECTKCDRSVEKVVLATMQELREQNLLATIDIDQLGETA